MKGNPAFTRGWSIAAKLAFWVERGEPDECWPWRGSIDDCGYGILSMNGRERKAHRHAWEEANDRAVPVGLVVMHSCDNPPCCNPAHISADTQRNNIRDSVRKGRTKPPGLKGSASPLAVLTERQVLDIREDPRKQHEIAADYGISRPHVSLIKSRRTWSHL